MDEQPLRSRPRREITSPQVRVGFAARSRARLRDGETLREFSRLTRDLCNLATAHDVVQATLDYLTGDDTAGAIGLTYDADRRTLLPLCASICRGDAALRREWRFQRYRFRPEHTNLCVGTLLSRAVAVGTSLHELLQPELAPELAQRLDEGFEVGVVATLPLWCNGHPWGVVCLWGRGQLDEDDVDTLACVAAVAEHAIEHVLLRSKLASEQASHEVSRSAFQDLFDTAIHPILVVDPVDGRILRANARACHYTGYEIGELLARSFLDLRIGDGPDSAARLIYRTVEQGAVRSDDAAIRRADGRVAFAELAARHITEGADLFAPEPGAGVIAVMLRDTTEKRAAQSKIQAAFDRLSGMVEDLQRSNAEVRKERERVLEANRLKSEFLANMSHELRTPMNAIIGFTSRVLKTGDDRLTPRERRNLNIVLRNSDQLLVMINDLLDFSRLEAGRMEIKPEKFHVYDLAEECAEIAGELLGEKPVELVIDCPADLTVETDRGKLRQILINLLSNAAKFTEKGRIDLSARRVKTAGGEDEIELSVADSGIGIKAAHLDLIFEAFRQVDGSWTRREGGTGLGLAITVKLADLLGGRMSVASVVEAGSTFTFHCPFVPPRVIVERGQRLGA